MKRKQDRIKEARALQAQADDTERCIVALYGERCGLPKGHKGLHDRDAIWKEKEPRG